MTLRDLKRSGGFMMPTEAGWRVTDPGELAKCPMPDCRRPFVRASRVSKIWARLAVPGVEDEREPSGFHICQDGRCRAEIEFRIVSASPKAYR